MEEVKDPYEFLCKECNISSSQEDNLRHNILFVGESRPDNSARIAVSSIDDEQGKVALQEEVKDPYEFISEKCNISSSQEDILLNNIHFAGESGPDNSARIAVSSIQDEQGKVALQEETLPRPHVPSKKSPAKIDILQSPPPPLQKNFALPTRGGPGCSSSNLKVPEEGEANQNLATVDILEIMQRKGIIFPRPRWWRPEGYTKEDQMGRKRKGERRLEG